MINNVFGELVYDDYGWSGETTIDWFGETISVDMVVSGEEGEEIDSLQCEAYEKFKSAWNSIKDDILDKVLSYYIDLRCQLGYDDSNVDYPEITTVNGIKEKIGIDAIIVPLPDVYNGRSIALAFHCQWDDENGIGIVLVNEKIYKIGYQDIVF